tara:strand:- start:277 stop:519 length:243 start_codon:yes stop_codon:yes gene_type:complete
MNWKDFENYDRRCSFLLKNNRYYEFAELVTCLEGQLVYELSFEGAEPQLLSLLKNVSFLKQKFGKQCGKSVYCLALSESK